MNGFKAYQIDTTAGPVPVYRRNDYYTMYLLSDHRQLQSDGRKIEPERPYLLLGTPSGEATSSWLPARQTGYGCLFTQAFVHACSIEDGWEPWLVFNNANKRVLSLQGPQAAYLTNLFERMLAEQQSAYLFKQDLVRSYLQLILLEFLRLPTPKRVFRYYHRVPGPEGTVGSRWLRLRRCQL